MESFIADIYLSIREERYAVISIMFHNIFSDPKEISFNNVHQQQFMTVEVFRQFINSMLECGYKFITPSQLKACKTKPDKYLLLTFDDGYFNNSFVFPVLKEFNVPGRYFFYFSEQHSVPKKLFVGCDLSKEVSTRRKTP